MDEQIEEDNFVVAEEEQEDPTFYVEEEEEEEVILINEEEDDDDAEIDLFTCKYCKFKTYILEDLDEHLVSHDEAIFEDNPENAEAEVEVEEITYTSNGYEDDEEGSENDEENVSSNDKTEKKVRRRRFSIEAGEPPGKKPKQRLPAFYSEYAEKGDKTVFVCPYCGYQSMKKSDLNRHLAEHRDPIEIPVFACNECSYTTRRKCDMPKHLLTHCKNGTVPMFRCSECPYSTKRKGDLTKHKLCHGKKSIIHQCEICSYASKRQGDLKKHVTCHLNDTTVREKIFYCSECGYTSKRLNDLHKHAVLHCDRAVIGAFKCPKCDYASLAGNPFAKHLLSNCTIMDMNVELSTNKNNAEIGNDTKYVIQQDFEDVPETSKRRASSGEELDEAINNNAKKIRIGNSNIVINEQVVILNSYKVQEHIEEE